MSELLRYIVQNLVAQPDQVHVDTREDEEGLTYSLRVAQEDIGKVIGKQGRTAKAIRALMAASRTEDNRARLELAEREEIKEDAAVE